MIEQLKKSRWYIDLRGQVQIMTAEQIIEGLLSLELKVIYRVSRDRQNWAAICNQEYFEKAVQEYIEHLSKEATKYGTEVGSIQNKDELSGFHNIKGLTTGINEQLEHADQLQEINVKLNSLRNLAAEIIAKKKLVIDLSTPKHVDELHIDDRNEYINAPTAWQLFVKRLFSGDKKFQRNVLIVVAAIFIVVFGTQKYFDLKEQKKIAEAKAQAEAALKAKLAGDYAKATALFAGIQNIQALDTQTLIAMADAHTQNKALDSASDLLKIALTKPASTDEMAKANAMMGLISIQKNQSENAIAYYQDSIKSGAIFDALYNLAVIHLDKAQPELSEPLLLKAVTFPHPEVAIAFLSLIEAAIQLDLATIKSETKDTKATPNAPQFLRLKNLSTLFDKLMIPDKPYFEEILVARLVVASVTGDHEGFYRLLPIWLDLDPKISAEKPYSYSLLYHRVTWNHIVRWCQDVYKNPGLNSLKGAFYAGCVARAKDLKDALPYAQYAYMNSDPKTAALRGFLGHLVWASENAVGTKQVLREGDITGSKLAQKTLQEVCLKFPDPLCPNTKPGQQ